MLAGVRWSSYGENPHLQDFFKVLSLSADRDERIYISTIEAHKVTATRPRLLPVSCYCFILSRHSEILEVCTQGVINLVYMHNLCSCTSILLYIVLRPRP